MTHTLTSEHVTTTKGGIRVQVSTFDALHLTPDEGWALIQGLIAALQKPGLAPEMTLVSNAELLCPHCKLYGTPIEHDVAFRQNDSDLVDGELQVVSESGNFETLAWACSHCGKLVDLPTGLSVEWF